MDWSFLEGLPDPIVRWAPSIAEFLVAALVALLILAVGWYIARRADRSVVRWIESRHQIDDTLGPFIGQIMRIGVLLVALIAALAQLGVSPASFIAVLGAAGLAVGLALKDSLANVASGIALLWVAPFHRGQLVETAGAFGNVETVGLFATQIADFDGTTHVVPNALVWQGRIKNYHTTPFRRVTLNVGISYGDDVDHALDVLRREMLDDERILDDPAPFFGVLSLDDSAVTLTGRVWVANDAWWDTLIDMTARVKKRFDADGVSIPFPQRDLHLIDVPEKLAS